MDSFCCALLDRGLVTLDVLDAVLARQLLHGGDTATNLLALGFLRENALHRLLAEHHELPAGPKGRLPSPPAEVVAHVSRDVLQRLRVYPYKRTAAALHVAVDEPLPAEAERELRALVELPVRQTVVSTARLAEALWHHCGGQPARSLANVIDTLKDDADRRAPPAPALYRRMSESPNGVRASRQQPGGTVLQPFSEPVRSEGPSPDSQGLWLDRLVHGGRDTVEAPPSSTTSEPPPMSDAPVASAPGTAPSSMNRPFAATIPAVAIEGQANGEYLADSMRGGALARHAPSPAVALPFRHRGPLDARAALAFAHECDDADRVLQIVARFARQYFERVLVFVVEGGAAEARVAYGLGAPLPSLELDVSTPSMFSRASASTTPVLGLLSGQGADAAAREVLGAGLPARAAAILPMVLHGRIAVLVYVDELHEAVDPESVAEVHTFCEAAATELARIALSRAPRL